jgi:hypothetical protein
MSTNLDEKPPVAANSTSAAPKKDNAPKEVKQSPPYPPTCPVDDPDALRPGSANDARNHSQFDPLHLSAGTEESGTEQSGPA